MGCSNQGTFVLFSHVRGRVIWMVRTVCPETAVTFCAHIHGSNQYSWLMVPVMVHGKS